MNISNGKVRNLKLTVKSGPVSIIGSRAVTNMMIKIIILNTMIRCLNFNGGAPIITYCWNHKINIMLRQPDRERWHE